jgi:succinoglycan biosynthesis protein ExoA
MLRRYPQTLRWRQALPPVFVLGVLALALLAPLWNLVGVLLAGVLLLYFLALLAGTLLKAGSKYNILLVPGIMLAIAAMHFSWGAGFLWSLVVDRFRQVK